MPAKTFTGLDIAGDVLKYYADEAYNLESLHVRNVHATLETPEGLSLAGLPVVVDLANGRCDLIKATDEANATGLIVQKASLDSALAINTGTTPGEYAVLVRGPAVVLQEGLRATDPYDTAYTIATLVTQLKTIEDIVVRLAQTALTTTQTS